MVALKKMRLWGWSLLLNTKYYQVFSSVSCTSVQPLCIAYTDYEALRTITHLYAVATYLLVGWFFWFFFLVLLFLLKTFPTNLMSSQVLFLFLRLYFLPLQHQYLLGFPSQRQSQALTGASLLFSHFIASSPVAILPQIIFCLPFPSLLYSVSVHCTINSIDTLFASTNTFELGWRLQAQHSQEGKILSPLEKGPCCSSLLCNSLSSPCKRCKQCMATVPSYLSESNTWKAKAHETVS